METTEKVDYKQLRADLLGWVEEQPVTDPQEPPDNAVVDLAEFDSRHNYTIERANGDEIGVQLVMRENLWWIYVEYLDGWELVESSGTGYLDAVRAVGYLRDRVHAADGEREVDEPPTRSLASRIIEWAIAVGMVLACIALAQSIW